MGLDLARLSRTLSFLLRHGADAAGLSADPEGWFGVEAVAVAAGRAIRRPVESDDVRVAAERHGGDRFDVAETRIRPRACSADGARPPQGPHGPDILYHAVPRARLGAIVRRGALSHPNGTPMQLSRVEGHAWRVGHRQWDDPVVLFVDAARARREGVSFERLRTGQYATEQVPVRHVLNLRDGFAEQASAGGFLVDWSLGAPRLALIRVVRRGGATWEVAKGKIEAGEPPHIAAMREVREEMGVRGPLEVSAVVGSIRYGFCTPDGAPRLKTIYLYVLEGREPELEFTPALAEGIEEVRWFSLDEACAVLAHPSLRGSIGRLLEVLDARAAELGLGDRMPRAS